MRESIGLAGGALVSSVLSIGALGCGGFGIVLPDVPEECFQEDVVDTDCFTESRLVEVCDEICEEDIFGFVECFEDCYFEEVVDVFCEDVVVDSYVVCE